MSSKPKKNAPKKKHTEEREPGVHQEPVPVLLFIVAILLVYWGMMYLNTNAGGFSRYVYGPYHSYDMVSAVQPGSANDPMKVGADAYQRYCSPCHQASGMGVPGQFPPLAGSDWVNTEGPNRIIRIILNGLGGPVDVNGVTYNAQMTPFGDTIVSDDELAAIVTYVRNSWGNEGSACTAEEVAAVRAESGDRSRPWSADELLKLPLEVQ